MENMDKELTVPKWVLIFRPKIPQMPQNLSAQLVCSSPTVLDFNEKKASLGVRSPWTQAFQTAVIWSLKLTSNLAQNWRCCYRRGHSWSSGWPSSNFLAFRSFWDNCKCLGIIHFKIKMSSFFGDCCPLPPRLKSKFHNSSVSRKQFIKITRKCQN